MGLYMEETSCSACTVVRDLSWPHGFSRRVLVWVPDVPAVEGFGDVTPAATANIIHIQKPTISLLIPS